MANIKSAKKRVGQSARRRNRNRAVRTRLRSVLKAYRAAEKKQKPERLAPTISEIDVALKKGVLHRNAAARYKSRLAKEAR